MFADQREFPETHVPRGDLQGLELARHYVPSVDLRIFEISRAPPNAKVTFKVVSVGEFADQL